MRTLTATATALASLSFRTTAFVERTSSADPSEGRRVSVATVSFGGLPWQVNK
jgi:hypothetical protein